MSKISKSIVISEFLWLLFFAVVFLKFDYTRTTLAVVNAIVWLCIVLVFSIIILQSYQQTRKICRRKQRTWRQNDLSARLAHASN